MEKKENKVIGILILTIVLVICVVAGVLYFNLNKTDYIKTSDVKKIIKEVIEID